MNSIVTPIVLLLFLLVNIQSAFAKDIIFKSSTDREQAIRNGRVWSQPSWIDANFQFSEVDIYNGSDVDAQFDLLYNDAVFCVTTEEDQQSSFGGRTPKFYCRLLASLNNSGTLTPILNAEGKTVKIKVKYPYAGGKPNNEIYGEVLGTRLLWALGFGADRMFYIPQVHCYGCSEDPYKTRQVDPSTAAKPRVFYPTAIEVKLAGDKMVSAGQAKQNQKQEEDESQAEAELVEGFSFKELMELLPADTSRQYYEFQQRDALRLLAVFIQHLDLKAENQKILCPSGSDANGNCPVQPLLYIQDIGASFGVSVKGFKLDKVNYKTFASQPVWSDAANCLANLNRPFLKDSSMKNPKISEAGRQFLARLLDGFSAGEAGRKRVQDLFRSARVEQRPTQETIEMWTQAFMDRVKAVKYPMGEQYPNFVCPEGKKKK